MTQTNAQPYEIILETDYLIVRAKRTDTEGIQLIVHAKSADGAEQFPRNHLMGINALHFEPLRSTDP